MTNSIRALIVDDEPDIRALLEITLGRMGVESHSAENLTQAKALLASTAFSVCLTDLRMQHESGLDLVKYCQKHYPQLPIAVLTAYGSMDTAIEAMKYGAFDFVSKPVDLSRLRELVNTALKVDQVSVNPDQALPNIIGESDNLHTLKKQIIKVSRSQAPVFISGESGTGKELSARLIHLQSPRKDAPFIAVNCGAIPTELMESEFFGHKKGSFTGADQDKNGLFMAAHQGTLFLDEVADLPLAMQVKLLRTLQEKTVRPIGDTKETPFDVRILSASHKNLLALVEAGTFRQDLYYRIHVIELSVPPLRERNLDILLLSQFFLNKMTKETGLDPVTLSKDAEQALLNYRFPGNIRELENILERAFTLTDNDIIQASDLQLHQDTTPTTSSMTNEDIPAGSDLESFLENIERAKITAALEATRWNKTKAAEVLGISFRALRYRLQKLGID